MAWERCRPSDAEVSEAKKQANITAIVVERLALIQARIWETKAHSGAYEILEPEEEAPETADNNDIGAARAREPRPTRYAAGSPHSVTASSPVERASSA